MLLSFRWIGGILNLTLSITYLSVKYFDCSEYSIDEIPKRYGTIMIFRGLLKDFHGYVSVKLVESCIGSS